MTQRFFTSDLHISHALVVRERGFGDDLDAHTAALAANWDSVVQKDDHVFVLGDIAMNPKKGAFDFIDARPGIKHLISGNHDATHPLHSRHLRAQQDWASLKIFATINSQGSVKINGTKVLLSHFPYTGEGSRDTEDRFTEWRFRNEGLPLLHGHEHKKNVFEPDMPNQFHVGLDSWDMKLVPEQAVEEWLQVIR